MATNRVDADRDGLRTLDEEPFYVETGHERTVFEQCHERQMGVMLKGPTGCGKTRFVEHMAWRLNRPLITVACHDDLSATDLTGRYLVQGGDTVWRDGPLTRAVREGAICYLDEIVEARQDTVVLIHPLTDDRRLLPVEKTGELLEASQEFQLVVSYNPGYQNMLKEMKPSTRQRFVTLEFDFPEEKVETRIVAHEAGVERTTARELVKLANRIRNLRDQGLVEVPSTRLLISTAHLIAGGIDRKVACQSGLVGPLTDDADLQAAITDVIDASLS
jgi:nitric oxide reductase NorQ protein